MTIQVKEKLKNKEFRKNFELERAKVALAQKIAEIREKEHLNQADLAKKLHVSQQFISQIETAHANNLTLDTLLKIANSFQNNNLPLSDPSMLLKYPPAPSNDSRLSAHFYSAARGILFQSRREVLLNAPWQGRRNKNH